MAERCWYINIVKYKSNGSTLCRCLEAMAGCACRFIENLRIFGVFIFLLW